jgi:hypothetical protein
VSTDVSIPKTPEAIERAAALRLYLAEQLAKDLPAFTKKAFHVLHPGRKLIWSPHYDWLCEYPQLIKGPSAAKAHYQRASQDIEINHRHHHFSYLGMAH